GGSPSGVRGLPWCSIGHGSGDGSRPDQLRRSTCRPPGMLRPASRGHSPPARKTLPCASWSGRLTAHSASLRALAAASVFWSARMDPHRLLAELNLPSRRPLLDYARRLIGDPHRAEDIVQETLLRAWLSAPRLWVDRPAAVRAWLFRVARNLAI